MVVFSSPMCVYSGVLFQDNFDSQPDWSPTQQKDYSYTIPESNGPLPTGYSGARVGISSYDPVGQNTMNINNSVYMGASGKSFIFYDEVGSGGWGSDGLLDISINPGASDIYIRFYIKFDPNFEWAAVGSSVMHKFLHVIHYDPEQPCVKDGKTNNCTTPFRYDFFNDNFNKPKYYFNLNYYGTSSPPKSDIASNSLASLVGDGGYNNPESRVIIKYFPLESAANVTENDSIKAGSYGGGGVTFGTPGMVGDGNWHCFEWRLKLNTVGNDLKGNPDGIAAFWQDGILIQETTDIVWVSGENPENRKWNMVMLGGNNFNFFADVSEKKEQWYAIDNLVISTEPIGQLDSIGAPTNLRITPNN